MLSFKYDSQLQMELAERAKKLRLLKALKRSSLAHHSGVSEASIKRFESIGEISLKSLIKIARALNSLDGIENFFKVPEFKTLDDIRKLEKLKDRKRGVK